LLQNNGYENFLFNATAMMYHDKFYILWLHEPKSRLFRSSINEQMLDYNGKNFLADKWACWQKLHTKQKKNWN